MAGSLYDVVEVDPATIFHPDIAANFEVIPDNVDGSYTKDSEGNFIAPTEAEIQPLLSRSSLLKVSFLQN